MKNAYATSANVPNRYIFSANTLNYCLDVADYNAYDVYKAKWETKLGGREINFSVHIRDDQKVGAKLGARSDFSDDVDLKYSRFKIPLIE